MLVLESFGNGAAVLCGALRRFPRRMWVHKPSPNRLSIHETVWHLADSEVVEYVNCRRFIAEPSSPPLGIDTFAWACGHRYFYQDIKEAVRIIRLLRNVVFCSLRALSPAVWSSTAEVPIYGRVSLDEWLEMRKRYFAEQLKRMEEIHSEWLEFTSLTKMARSSHKMRPVELRRS